MPQVDGVKGQANDTAVMNSRCYLIQFTPRRPPESSPFLCDSYSYSYSYSKKTNRLSTFGSGVFAVR